MDQTKSVIDSEGVNAEYAFKQVTDTFITMFEGMEDNAYMQERAADIRDVRKRVIANLLNVTLPSPATIDEEVIIIAEDLTHDVTIKQKVCKGFCNEYRRTY